MQSYLDQQQSHRGKRSFRIKLYFGLLILNLMIVMAAYILVYSPVFKIKEFKIAGIYWHRTEDVLRAIEPQILNTKIKNFLGNKNLLVWDIDNPDLSKTAFAEA